VPRQIFPRFVLRSPLPMFFPPRSVIKHYIDAASMAIIGPDLPANLRHKIFIYIPLP